MTMALEQLVLVAAGGAIGAWARFALGIVVARYVGEAFPWGTLLVNLSGALAIGLLAAGLPGADENAGVWFDLRLALMVGVLASYTTVSAFSLQTLALAEAGGTTQATLYVLASVSLCLGAVFAGHRAGLLLSGS